MRSDPLTAPQGLRSRLLRTGVAALMSALVPAQAAAAAAPGASAPKPPAPSQAPAISVWSDKGSKAVAAEVDAAVTNAFRKADKVTYLVKMRTRADVESAAVSARAAAASPAQAALSARHAVITSLKEVAEVSQAGLLTYLEKAQAAGSVTDYKPHWITNMVVVTSDQATMEQIARRGDVEKIYPNGKIHLVGGGAAKTEAAAVADALAREKAEAEAAGPGIESIEWNITRVGAPAAWDQFGIDGTGSVVASLDTGVDGNHPALHDKFRGYDPATGQIDTTFSWFDAVNDRNQSPYDDHGHGTHTTGTMVGSDPSGQNQIGVAPGATWIAAKILDSGGYGTDVDIIEAGEWVLAPGGDPSKAPDVVSNSWGGGPGLDEWFREIVASWRAAGIVPVFANGNDGPGAGTVANPGNYPESIGVGATDSSDNLASFSSRGPSPYGEIKPELSAPGVNVRSAVPGGGYEGGWSGTSMATPHVSGAVALLRQADASLTVDEIELILTSSADPKTNEQYPDVPNNGFGHGILNAYTAVGQVVSGIGSVSGRVVTSGDDLTAPTLTHTPIAEAFKHTDIAVEADVADDVSITSVQLRFRQPGMRFWGVIDMEQVSGDHRSGRYAGVIPAEIATTDTLEYYIQVVDYGGNSAYSGTKQNPHTIALLDGITPGYLQDWEGAATGWRMFGTPEGVWQVGEPTSGPGAAFSGTRVVATNLSGDYPNNADAYLLSPPIDLSGGPAALRFHHWYQFETNYDVGLVGVSGDGGQTWETVAQYTGSGTSYTEAVIDLSAYAGNPSVYVVFYLTTDGSVTRPGWYIDDVELYVDTEAPAPPADLTAQATAVGTVSLSWSPVTAGDLDHYTVYRSTSSGSGHAAIGEATGTVFTDGNVTAGTTYYYVVTATDRFGNESGYSNESSVTVADVVTRFFDDMEAGPGTWTHGGANDSWEWGAPTSGPGGAFSGQDLWATSLAGNYPHNSNASLVSAPIDLAGLSTVQLQFAHWYRLERNYDFGRVEVSNDSGATWTQLAQYTSAGPGGAPVGWESPLIDLTGYAGQTIQIRFRLTSDSSVNYPGWYIDDVRVAGLTAGGTAFEQPLSVPVDDADPLLKDGAKPAEAREVKAVIPRSKGSGFRTDAGSSSIGISSLPMEATVTVVETGRVVRTNPADGSYSITMPAGTYSLRAEAYGYYPAEQQVEVLDNANTTANFLMQPIPHGTIRGTVTNQRDGSPIAGATVRVVEDPRVAPVTTDADGQFILDVLAGTYTVEVRHPSYYPAEAVAEVPADGTAELSIAMTPFVGMPGEIGYDDGTAENAWAFYAAGNGWAVRMSPEKPDQTAFVTAARIFLWDESWPSPGGNEFQAAIFAANADGSPGALLAGPVTIDNAVRGDWNTVDFSSSGVAVNDDFYVAYIQAADHPNAPGLGFDETSDQGRTWQVIDGGWSLWDQGGNAMIRAEVTYGVGAPTISAPADGSYTNQTEVQVEGSGVAGTTVTLYVDGVEAATTQPDPDGHFAAALTLTEGEHEITATATVPGRGTGSGTTDPSAPVRVVVDLTAPELTVSAPADGASQNSRLLSVSGQAADAHLAAVTVGDTAATPTDDGQFAAEVIGQEGENVLSIVATDLAGNASTVTRTVYVDSVAPSLSNLIPAAEQNLMPGDSLTLSFDSEAGLALAAFRIVVGTGSSGASATDGQPLTLEPGETAMAETSPGHYEATWTVPEGMSLPTGYVQFRGVDAAGNTARATAEGVLHIGSGDGGGAEAPQAVIQGPETARVRKSVTFSGTASTAPEGRKIVAYRWEMGDGKTYKTAKVKHSWRQAGTYTVTLTVTDDTGATGTATLTVVVTNK